jgi:hypothetical protein
MKKSFSLLFSAGVLALALASCNQPAPTMDATKMSAKVDSLYNAQLTSVTEEMDKMCTENFEASVKMKCDSICEAAGMPMDQGKM